MSEPTGSQQQAMAARGNVLVVAGAGTGKTSTLVQRCLALLEEGCSLENILMVTFTDAAAAEMRRRIREELQNRIKELEKSAGIVATRSAPFEKQLALLDAAPISTLHSFCLRLVREHFHELQIDPEVIVLDEPQTQPLIRQTLETLFERNYAGETANAPAVQALVRVPGGGSDTRIRALVLRLHRYSQSRADPERWLEEQLTMLRQPVPAQWREWFVEGFQNWLNLWLPALNQFAGNPAVNLAAGALQAVPDRPSMAQIAGALLAIRSADEHEDNWPYGSKKNVRDHIEDFFAEAEFLRSLAPEPGRDPLAEDWELVRHHLVALIELAKEFTAGFSRAKRELGGVDFADLEQFALRLLRDPHNGRLTATALGWREQLHHVFVDEYQDINAAQDAILTALSGDDDAGNRFLVGDVKQSIYRFRLADPAIFRGYELRWGGGGANARRIPLSDNFRSRAGILEFINRLFGALMRAEIGGVPYEGLNFANAPGRTLPAGGKEQSPRVEFHLIARGDEPNDGDREGGGGKDPGPADVADLLAVEREARLVALQLRELQQKRHEIWDKAKEMFRPVHWNDMVVLLRSPAGRVEAFAQEFDRLGVPLEAARGGFFESIEISDLLCLLKLIDNPMQDIPLLAVLRSPLVGLSVDELAELRAQNRESSFWLTVRRFHREARGAETNAPTFPEASGWKKVDLFVRQLDAWRGLIRQTSLTHCLETALAETHYVEMLLAGPRGAQRVANIHRLLDLTRQYDPYQRQGLFRFLRFVEAQEELDREPALAPTADAVRLMSIHKSKGQEFPVVVLAGLGGQFNLRDLQDDILLDETYGLCPKVAPPEGEQRYPSLPYWLARRRQRRELLGEELRLLYVAMTRAGDTLLLTASSSRKGDPKWAAAGTRPLSDSEMLSARGYLDWLMLWLPQVTRETDWVNGHEGRNELFCWKIHDPCDSMFALSVNAQSEAGAQGAERVPTAAELTELRARLQWRYGREAATHEPAKTSVTGLRRRWRDETDEEARESFQTPGSGFQVGSRARAAVNQLTAAEIGTAHHTFLQKVSLERTGSRQELQNEAERLRHEAILSAEEVEVLKFDDVLAFWLSELGRNIRAQTPDRIHRELPFTARMSRADLEAAKLSGNTGLPDDEFVVVQGVADVAIILPEEIWLVDFKTDDVDSRELAAKLSFYEPQLKLYALALSRIYRRPATKLWLHFLALKKTIPVGSGI